MRQDNLPHLDSYQRVSRSAFLDLKGAMVRGLCDDNEQNWLFENPPLTRRMEASLRSEHIELLMQLNLVHAQGNTFAWNFQPFFGNDVLLFRDLNCHRFKQQYVWLQTSVDSGSWSLPESVRVSKGMKVLDLGCGSGLNALRSAVKGAHSTGIDINPRAVQLANFNRVLNNIENARFFHSDWSQFTCSDYDLVISQPPFDPCLPDGNKAYAFGGGANCGLGCTEQILKFFQPQQHHQIMQLYVHSFANESGSLLESVLCKTLRQENSFALLHLKSYQLEPWWMKYKDRHHLSADREMPLEWRRFKEVKAYFVTVYQRSEAQDNAACA